MQSFFSKTSLGFYTSVNAGRMPADAKAITQETYLAMLAAERAGKIIDSDVHGLPIAKDPQQPSVESLLSRVKDELRAIREPMLSAITGIGWEASEAGQADLVAEARAIRNALRDITLDPSLNAARTYEAMRAAGLAAYQRIAADAHPAFAATFRVIAEQENMVSAE